MQTSAGPTGLQWLPTGQSAPPAQVRVQMPSPVAELVSKQFRPKGAHTALLAQVKPMPVAGLVSPPALLSLPGVAS